MYKILFIDIDGTLLTSDHKISSGTLSAIQRVRKVNKIKVILTSARPPQAVKKIYSQLDLDSPVVYFNGALILQKNDSCLLHTATVNTSFLGVINNAAVQYKLSISFYKTDEWFSDNLNSWIDQEEQITGVKATIVNSNSQIEKWKNESEGPHKILLMGEPRDIDLIEPVLKEHTGHQLNIYKSKPTYLEIMNGSASKKSAMLFLLEKYGLTDKDVMAIGDNYNDIEMLQYAGLGIAMGNSPEEVKAHARFITLDNDSDGIKFALDKFVK
jgi:Cof subfamily protein (haloacid dehalogenase superfamily)